MFRVPEGSVGASVVTLDGPEGHHAADVRRLRVGESIWLTDGQGARGAGAVVAVRRGSLDVEVADWSTDQPASPRLVVAQALAKGGRDEAAVEAMTEIGVDEVIGWQASRSVAKWTERTGAKWESVSRAAARQSRRAWWPTVTGPVSTPELATRVRDADLAVVLHESAAWSISALELSNAGVVLVVVGPEGGVSEDELAAFVAAGAQPVRLGDTVLRSSTAGVAALAAILARTRWTWI